jgi:hypothetical protein
VPEQSHDRRDEPTEGRPEEPTEPAPEQSARPDSPQLPRDAASTNSAMQEPAPAGRARTHDEKRTSPAEDHEQPPLPDVPFDETDAAWGDYPQSSDDWLREQRPPHYE